MNETETDTAPTEGQMSDQPTSQTDDVELAIPDTAIKDGDLAHDMAIAGDYDRSIAAVSRAKVKLIEDAVKGREEIEKERPRNIDSPTYSEDLAAHEGRLREFYRGIGERDMSNRRKHLGSIIRKPVQDLSDEDRVVEQVQRGEWFADPTNNDVGGRLSTAEREAKIEDRGAERKEWIVKLLHDHPELVMPDGTPMTPGIYESAIETWDYIDKIEDEALFTEASDIAISRQLSNMCKSVENYAVGDNSDEADEAVKEVFKLASDGGTTVGQIREAAAKVVRGLKRPLEEDFGTRISLTNHEAS